MKPDYRSVILAAILLSLEASSAFGEIPPVLYSGPEKEVAFVRVDAALKPDGSLDRSLFSQYDIDVLQAYMKLPAENGCVRLRGVIRDHVNMRPLSSLKEATREAKLVLKGVVVSQAQGFMGSEAGTLLEVGPEEALKGAHQNTSSSYYVFFPIGNFELLNRAYCAFNPDWPALPEVGDRLLLFIRNQIPSSNFLPLLDGTDVVVLRKSGPDLPPAYKAERALKGLTSAATLEKVLSYVQEEHH